MLPFAISIANHNRFITSKTPLLISDFCHFSFCFEGFIDLLVAFLRGTLFVKFPVARNPLVLVFHGFGELAVSLFLEPGDLSVSFVLRAHFSSTLDSP